MSKQINRQPDIDRLVYSKQEYDKALADYRSSVEENMREELFKPLTGRGPKIPPFTQENVKASEERRNSSIGVTSPS